MTVSRYNPEGYPDPTPHEALTNILREERENYGFRPVVYICSPYSGDEVANTKAAEKYCRMAVERKKIPFAPHLLYPHFMNEEKERLLALFMGKVMLDKCAEVWVFGDTISDGMKKEILRAKSKKKIIRYFTTDGKEKNKNE